MQKPLSAGPPENERAHPREECAPQIQTSGIGSDHTAGTTGAQGVARKPAPKWMRTLHELLGRSSSTDPRAWLNRFLAERICRDHTLPSTISELERTKGLRFERQEIEVAGYAGEKARVMAYRLAPESAELARQLLEPRGAA